MNTDLVIQFPAILIKEESLIVERTLEGLTTCSKAALGNRFFDNALLLGCNGKAQVIISATKLKGIGLFLGYDLFLNQRIRVALAVKNDAFDFTMEYLRAKVGSVLRRRRSGAYSEIIASIESAENFSEIVSILENL